MAGTSTVGKIQYIVDVDTKGLTKGLGDAESAVGKSEGKLSKGFAAIGKAAAVGLAAAATAVAGLATAAVKGFADYEQLVGGVETLFKDSSSQVMEYANNAYKTAGMSANQYMETVTGFSASLLQGLGGDTAEAARIGDMAVTDMSDNANKMGTSIERIQDAYQGFAKQNYTMLDNLKLGYGGTKTEMERLLKDAEKMPEAMGQKFDLNNYADVIKAINVVQQNMGITGTTAKEASETISGSINTMKASWSNLVTGLADENADFDQLLNNFIESAGNVLKNIVPVIKTALSGIANLIKEIAPIIIAELPALIDSVLPPLLEAAVSIIVAIVEALPGLIETIFNALVAILPTLIDAIVTILPMLLTALVNLIIVIVKKLTEPETLTMLLQGAIEMFLAIVKAIPEIIVALVDALPDIIMNIIDFLTDPNTIMMMIDAAIQLFMALVMAIPQILGALFNAFGKLFGMLWDKLQGLFSEFAGNFGEAIGGVFKGAINGVLGFIEGFINGPIDLINGAISLINNIPGVNIGQLGRIQLPRLATGGIVQATPGGRAIIAGEGGQDEWVIPENKMASLVSQLTGAGGDTYYIDMSGVIAAKESDKRDFAKEMIKQADIIKRSQMGAAGVAI